MAGFIKNKYRVISARDLRCGNCGTCCSIFSNLDIHITDIFKISEHLHIRPEEFFNIYCKVIGDDSDNSMFVIDVEGGCKFRKDNKCTIYEVRPDTCSLFPFDFPCVNISDIAKKDMSADHAGCFVHSLGNDLIIVPDIERMIDSRILFMAKNMYMAKHGSSFDEEEARAYHENGLSQLKNPRMREMMRRLLMREFQKDPPADEETGEPILSEEDLKQIFDNI